MNKSVKLFYILALVAVFFSGCSDRGEDPEKETPWWEEHSEEKGGKEPLYERDGFPVMGKVCLENGTGILGCVVSDGINVTKTDASGRYWLSTDLSVSDYVFISIPSGYEVGVDSKNGILPEMYRKLDKAGKGVQTQSFTLKKVDQSEYSLIVLADMHIQNRNIASESGGKSKLNGTDLTIFKTVCLPYLSDYVAKKSGPVYGINLGDMTMSQYWGGSRKADFNNYLTAMKGVEMPIFHVIGNHDHEHNKADDWQSGAEYRSYFGPTWYSFNIGKHHFVALDNMDVYNGDNANAFKRTIGSAQMNWLKKDLEALDPAVKDVVVLCHLPFATWSAPSSNTSKVSAVPYIDDTEYDDFIRIFRKFNVTILSGHMHTSQSFRISDNMVQHTFPAVCGTYWYTLLNSDGTPTCFVDMHSSADGVFSRSVRPFPTAYRDRGYTVYNNGVTTQTGYTQFTGAGSLDGVDETTGYKPAILVNFYIWNPSWKIQVFENGQGGTGSMVWRCDLDELEAFKNGEVNYTKHSWLRVIRNLHMFQYVPASKNSLITILVRDENDELIYNIKDIQIK